MTRRYFIAALSLGRCSIATLLLTILTASNSDAAELNLQISKGDHVACIGNTLADRMQHHAWLETYIQALFPEHDLTFRIPGYSADEIKRRHRTQSFGSPDQWLTQVEADAVFCFFGRNEALNGDSGLEGFRKDLAEMLDGMSSQKYNGKSAPQIVVFSPIAHENVKSPHLPDGAAQNVNLENTQRRYSSSVRTRVSSLSTSSLRQKASTQTPKSRLR